MTPLADLIAAEIRANGPMNIARYMDLCLAHPEYGYYMTRDPFGTAGDFTTAPEISQMFGEMSGAWLADVWIKSGRVEPFALVECGPGRGTLMADILRATKGVEGFQGALSVHLLEMSPILKEKQAEALIGFPVTWHGTLNTLPADRPLMVIGNEFLDALPIRQYVYQDEKWHEKMVDLDKNGAFRFVLKTLQKAENEGLLQLYPHSRDGDVREDSSVLNQFLKALFFRLKKQGGTALFMDYGHVLPAGGDTLQALRTHRFVSPLESPGEVDITAHVDFSNIVSLATEAGLSVHGPAGQGTFLTTLGIYARAKILMKTASEQQRVDLHAALHRLTAPEAMGDLFKVVAICEDPAITPAGFA